MVDWVKVPLSFGDGSGLADRISIVECILSYDPMRRIVWNVEPICPYPPSEKLILCKDATRIRFHSSYIAHCCSIPVDREFAFAMPRRSPFGMLQLGTGAQNQAACDDLVRELGIDAGTMIIHVRLAEHFQKNHIYGLDWARHFAVESLVKKSQLVLDGLAPNKIVVWHGGEREGVLLHSTLKASVCQVVREFDWTTYGSLNTATSRWEKLRFQRHSSIDSVLNQLFLMSKAGWILRTMGNFPYLVTRMENNQAAIVDIGCAFDAACWKQKNYTPVGASTLRAPDFSYLQH